MKAKTDGKWERKSDSEGGKQGVRSNLRNEERVEKNTKNGVTKIEISRGWQMGE